MFCELWDGLVEKLQFNQMETEQRNFLQVLETSKPNIFILWEVIAASTDTCAPLKYLEMRQLLPISTVIVPLVHWWW